MRTVMTQGLVNKRACLGGIRHMGIDLGMKIMLFRIKWKRRYPPFGMQILIRVIAGG